MCGIAGFVGNGNRDELKKMCRHLAHRGPDQEGIWYQAVQRVYLGHRRLSIIDIKQGGQPMLSGDNKISLVFNGEIYNHKELRDELTNKGHQFRTHHSDTEVLIHGYEEWGEQLPRKLNGMWAFALFDVEKKRLFLSRDRFGQKPLFYYKRGETFVFASECSVVKMHHSVENENYSTKALAKFFAYGFIPAPLTVYENVYKLPGGCNLFFDVSNSKLTIKRYWKFSLEPDIGLLHNSEDMMCEQISDLLLKSVNRRLLSDVPLGIFLSGGIDSSIVTAMASQCLHPSEIKTFTIGFNEPTFDESNPASIAAEFFKTRHNERKFTIEDMLGHSYAILNRLDEPLGDASLLPTFLLCKSAKEKVTVALSGDGADELFAGYDPFRALYPAEVYNRIIHKKIHPFIKYIANLLPVGHNNMSFDFRIKKMLQGLSYNRKIWNPVWLGSLDPYEINSLLFTSYTIEDLYSEAITLWDEHRGASLVDQTLYFYTNLYLPDDILMKIDRASMMNSLEVRSPFLDIEFVNYISTIPWQMKLRNGCSKYILKKSFENKIPPDILNRTKKGFGIPTGKWFKDQSICIKKPVLEGVVSQKITAIKELRHLTGRENNRLFLWNLFVLNNYPLFKK